MNICEDHGDSAVVYNGYSCPACDYIEELQNEHSKTVDDLEQQLSEADEKIGDLEYELQRQGGNEQ